MIVSAWENALASNHIDHVKMGGGAAEIASTCKNQPIPSISKNPVTFTHIQQPTNNASNSNLNAHSFLNNGSLTSKINEITPVTAINNSSNKKRKRDPRDELTKDLKDSYV